MQNFHRREHPDLALAVIDLAGTIDRKYPEEAETLCRKSLAMRRNLFGEEHADTAWSYYNLTFVLINRGKFSEAEENILKVLQKRGANLPAEHPVVGSCLLLLGRISMAQGKFFKAEAEFLECLELRRKTLPEDHLGETAKKNSAQTTNKPDRLLKDCRNSFNSAHSKLVRETENKIQF